jgi:alcohol dehydrogenase YqhD (iron-dependent ADH family)
LVLEIFIPEALKEKRNGQQKKVVELREQVWNTAAHYDTVQVSDTTKMKRITEAGQQKIK